MQRNCLKQLGTNIEFWSVYDDVLLSLEHFRREGWRHFILSNHVPELAALVSNLGLGSYFDYVFNSVQIGFEKPNQAFFQHVLSDLPDHDQVWMIGDSYTADVLGAAKANIPAVLVRKTHESAKLQCSSLSDLESIIV